MISRRRMGYALNRAFLVLALGAITAQRLSAAEEPQPPNLVVIFVDDMGYGDLGCYGHPTVDTPRLDQMAREGMRFTQFYAGASVCTPSRAALLTGRLPIRSGMCGDRRRVLFADSKGGLPADEITLAEALQAAGYATGCIGKWHLGHRPEFLPTQQGFDSYFGIPYSNDMDRVKDSPPYREGILQPKSEYFNVPLMRGEKIVERPAHQPTITSRYTEEAVEFIETHREQPFFLYLAHNQPHVPLFRSSEFEGVSRRGEYGDVLAEIDHGVGQVLDALKENQIDENTLVFFTSDNGPWLPFDTHGGSAGPLREGKGTTWEGGMRVPGIAWWPKRIEPGQVSHELGSTMDLFATMHGLLGRDLPDDRTLDSYDLSPVLFENGPSNRDSMFYYRGTRLMAVRLGPWKAHFITEGSYGGPKIQQHDPPQLFQLEHDPGEKYNIAAEHPEVLSRIREAVSQHKAKLKVGASQLDR